MSLITDKVFYHALLANSSIVNTTDGRIYNTAIPVPDEELDNEPLPYIIITFDGLTNGGLTKDDSYEGSDDTVHIGITIAAEDRESLGDLTVAVRRQIKAYFAETTVTDSDYDLVPLDYEFTASDIQYDPAKPCYYQTLNYECDTNAE